MTTKSDKVAVNWTRLDIEALGRLLKHVDEHFKGVVYNASWQDREWDAADHDDITVMYKLMLGGLPKEEPKPAPRVRIRPNGIERADMVQRVATDSPVRRSRIIRRDRIDR